MPIMLFVGRPANLCTIFINYYAHPRPQKPVVVGGGGDSMIPGYSSFQLVMDSKQEKKVLVYKVQRAANNKVPRKPDYRRK